MYVKNLAVKNFGIFRNLDILFCNDKINIIQGENGCGKTTILAILYSMLQDSEIMHYKCEEVEATIRLEIADKTGRIWINKRYRDGNYEITVKSFDEMKRLLSINRKNIYLLSESFIHRRPKLNGEMIENAKRLLEMMGMEDNHKIVFSESKSYNVMSVGMQAYYWILNVLFSTPPGSVLFMDDPFAMLDTCTAKNLFVIMNKMNDIQFILTGNLSMDVPEDCNRILVNEYRNEWENCKRVQFDYLRVFDNNLSIMNADKKEKDFFSERPIIKYELEKEIEEVEKRNVEFKEIKGNNPCDSIIDTAEIYINAFLNSKTVGIGIIKWGISDGGIVTGVKLSKKDRDTINRKISERIGQMKPYVSTDCIRISFEQVAYNDEIVHDLYVVEISVEPIPSELLFVTSKNEIYMKTDGGKRKLDAIQIQEELQRRKR